MNSLGVRWPDAELEGFCVDYDKVEIRLVEPGGGRVLVRAHGHIGVALPGFWDEVVIEDGGVHAGSGLQVQAETKARSVSGDFADESGNEARNGARFQTLTVNFIDGCTLEVVAAVFEVMRQ
jgi:hypothetical protein